MGHFARCQHDCGDYRKPFGPSSVHVINNPQIIKGEFPMEKFLKQLAGKASRVASQSFAFCKRHSVALVAATMCLAGSAMAEGEVAAAGTIDPNTVTIVTKDSSGLVTFTPEKIVSPIVDAVIAGYAKWALLFLVVLGVGWLIWIIAKKK